MDGTWLYYTLVQGRGASCPIKAKFGPFWQSTHKINWSKLTHILSRKISEQLSLQTGYDRCVDIVRVSVFTSTRQDTPEGSYRAKMLEDLSANNFEVTCLTTERDQEKCVDISLAVEMLYMATVPDAYNLAIIITGDKDFMPAMQKTRMTGKRVALCSMRNSCNRDLTKIEPCIRDFDVIWLDDYLDELIVPRISNGSKFFIF